MDRLPQRPQAQPFGLEGWQKGEKITDAQPLSHRLKEQEALLKEFLFLFPSSFERNRLGLKGSPTRVNRVYTPEIKKQGKMINLDEVGVEAAVEEIIKLLKAKGIL